jgi:ABC-type transport system involved in multi-copper enzyme maturation permease subunit
MKKTILITVVLAIIPVAIVGCLAIFEVISMDVAGPTLVKVVLAILLLGGCTALIGFLVGTMKKKPTK